MEPQLRYKEKSVIIHRDENGFGLRVGGQNPVFVDYVHENGAAWKAGVRQNDRIIKVNGTLVRSYDHQRVVQMIQNCTPFVNLTLHSPETIMPLDHSYAGIVSAGGILGASTSDLVSNPCGSGLHLSHSSSNISMVNNNLSSATIQVHPMHHHPAHLHQIPQRPYASIHPQNHHRQHPMNSRQRRHHSNPHSMTGNHDCLLEIGHDLFQDSQQHFQHQRSSVPLSGALGSHHQHEIIPADATSNHAGVSKLIVSGPNPLVSSSSNLNNTTSKLEQRLAKQQQPITNSRENPYYYYKTAPEKASDATSSCNSSSTASLLGQDQQQQGTSSKVSSSLSIVRSRSSGKMSIRSTTGKYKPRNLRSRLVEDLRSLTITNNSQTTPSSLSTSPSSSDLSDCDDPETSRLDCLALNNTSNLSNSPGGVGGVLGSANNANTTTSGASLIVKSKITTRRLEIIRELVETEKTHTEKLKQLNDLLYKPIKAENLIPPDQLKMVFSCHKSLFKIHRQIYKKLVAAQINVSDIHQEPLVGKALMEIFDGDLGKRLEKAACLFCACQSTNSDLLNRITRKDTKSGEFLAQVANQQMLGRLGIKDLLASCFQRLTKYPLLLDNLLKATPNTGSSGMMHSKSLSEGSIAICPTVHASSIVSTTSNVTETSADIHQESQAAPGSAPTEQSTVTNDQNSPSATVSRSNSLVSENSNEESENDTIDENTTISNSTSAIITTTNTATTTTTSTSTLNANNANNTSVLSSCSNTAASDEYAYERLCIERALHLSRQILIRVNEAVNKAIAQNKLKEVWKKTDKNPALPVIDIESQQLLHEGSLTLRLARRSFEVYVVLLTHYLIILTREGQDKYKLKYFTSDGKSAKHFSPIFNIDEHLVTRDSATDENGFYLLCKQRDDSRIYEFASQSPADRAKWKEKIHMAQLYNFAAVPEDDNTLTRYTELISLATSCNTPNNVQHSSNAPNISDNLAINNNYNNNNNTSATKNIPSQATTTTPASPTEDPDNNNC